MNWQRLNIKSLMLPYSQCSHHLQYCRKGHQRQIYEDVLHLQLHVCSRTKNDISLHVIEGDCVFNCIIDEPTAVSWTSDCIASVFVFQQPDSSHSQFLHAMERKAQVVRLTCYSYQITGIVPTALRTSIDVRLVIFTAELFSALAPRGSHSMPCVGLLLTGRRMACVASTLLR